ncbi:AAEL006898-PA [Aedes aegypti]|uniref:AAEL006898-PA n=1 Tax=Aedes aegypti TaxID=7159 RepID=Q174G4_AEDAE|nr:AAEL006898-PA [Aedes aegypti]
MFQKTCQMLSPLNMPDYAEVAGCSSFKNDLGGSPSYDNYGAYASTTLVGRSIGNAASNGTSVASGAPMFAQQQNQFDGKNVYSAPTSCHYNNFINQHQLCHQQQLHQPPSAAGVEPKRPGGSYGGSMKSQKMNIIENRMADMMNNLGHSQTSVASASAVVPGLPGSPYGGSSVSNLNANSSSNLLPVAGASVSVPHTPLFGTIKRTTKYNKIGYNKDNKLNFGDNGRSTEQPLFIKSKYDGTWSSVPSTAASSANNINMINNSPYHQQQQQQLQHHHQSQSQLPLLGHHHHQPATTTSTSHQFPGKGPGSSNILDPLPNGCSAADYDDDDDDDDCCPCSAVDEVILNDDDHDDG